MWQCQCDVIHWGPSMPSFQCQNCKSVAQYLEFSHMNPLQLCLTHYHCCVLSSFFVHMFICWFSNSWASNLVITSINWCFFDFQQNLFTKQALLTAQRILEELIDGIRTPERPCSPVDAYITEEELFQQQNKGVSLHFYGRTSICLVVVTVCV